MASRATARYGFLGITIGLLLLAMAESATAPIAPETKRGLEEFNSGRVEQAVRIWKPLADKGDTRAQVFLGNVYGMGKLGKPDFKEARRWWEIAARAGDVQAQFNLGALLLNGDGTNPQPAEGLAWLMEAAAGGSEKGLAYAGQTYTEGSATNRDEVMAYMLCRTAMTRRTMTAGAVLGNITGGWSDEKLAEVRGKALKLTWCHSLLSTNELLNSELDRDERHTYFLDLGFRHLFGTQGRIDHPADSNPQLKSFDTLRAVAVESARRNLGGESADGLLAFVAYVPTLRPDGPEVIPLTAKQIWDIARPTDWVSLSDRVTHHMTAVYRVDRAAQRIYFVDSWPDRFFLREGRNVAGVRAETTPFGKTRQLVSISKAEFERVANGLMTFASSEFCDSLLAAMPELKTNAAVRLAFGATMLHRQNVLSVRTAVAEISAALRLTSPALTDTARRQALDLRDLGLEYLREAKKDGLLDELPEELTVNSKQFVDPRDKKYQTLDPYDFARLIEVKSNLGEEKEIETLVSAALKRNPTNETFLMARAGLALDRKDTQGAIRALTSMITTLEWKLGQTNALFFIDPNNEKRAPSSDSWAKLQTWLYQGLTMRAEANLAADKAKEAVSDALAARRLRPKDRASAKILAAGYKKLGDDKNARLYEEEVSSSGSSDLISQIIGIRLDDE